MSARASGPGSKSALAAVLVDVRRRWRLRRAAEGFALALGVIFLAASVAVLVMDQSLFEAGVVAAARTALLILAGTALALLLLPPLLRRASDSFLARYVESKLPRLDALLVSAVEANSPDAPGGGARSGPLSRALAARAAAECGASPAVAGLERTRLRRAAGAAGVVVVLSAGLLALGPEGWRHGAGLLLSGSSGPPGTAGPYAIELTPGDVSVLAGEDIHVSAAAKGFRPETLVLVHRRDGDMAWTRTPLSSSDEPGVFEGYLFDLAASTSYRVEHETLASAGHRIEVIPRPLAERIDLLYRFPRYTGRAPERVLDGGDITAVQGTRVEIRVVPDSPVQSGRLLIDGEREVPLSPGADGSLEAAIEITNAGRYRVELGVPGYGMAPASPEYAIVAHADTLPSVELLSPGRDTRVTSIEEVVIAARARDDVAVRNFELVMSVNGGPDEVVPLGAGGPLPALEGGHELFLEQRALAPGDLIAYYVRASDAPLDPARLVSSDIFFMDVRPFEMRYRQTDGGGGGGAGGGAGQGEETLAAQQRTLVVALFKLLRDRDGMPEPVAAERVETLGTAQTRIRDRVDAIVRRLQARSIIESSRGYQRMAEELPRAAKSMLEVEALLAAGDVREALPPARQALLHLQRADSAFRDAQVAQNRQGGGGGGGAAENDLANLFRLEMDRFRSPYEDMQRGDWTPPEQRLDDALRRLRELAERHQREVERGGFPGRGADGDRQALAEELEELARELERLSRRQPSENLSASARALEEAARALREGASGGSGGGADASQRLREARRLLDRERSGRLADDTRQALREAEEMVAEQSEIERGVARRSSEDAGPEPFELAERKRALAGDVAELEAQLERLARGAGGDAPPDAVRELEGAARSLREERLAERIRRSGERLERNANALSPGEEPRFTRSLENLRDRIAGAARSLGEGGGPDLSGIHEELRTAMRSVDRERQALADQARRGPALPGGTDAGPGERRSADPGPATGQRLDDLRGLAGSLARSPGFEGDAETLRAAIEAARDGRNADPETRARQHAALLAALQEMERRLRERLADTETPPAWGPPRTEPPLDQRESVEAYYRNLSEMETSPGTTQFGNENTE